MVEWTNGWSEAPLKELSIDVKVWGLRLEVVDSVVGRGVIRNTPIGIVSLVDVRHPQTGNLSKCFQ